MKRIINGKVYDTDKSECIGEWSNGYSGGDFRRVTIDLMRTKNGQFFLWGSGGPMTEYAESYGNETSGGSQFDLMTEAEAKEWAEEHLSAEVCLQHWPYEEG